MTGASRASSCLRKVRNPTPRSPLIRMSHSPLTVLNPQTSNEPSGSWDSIHVFEASERGRQAHYKLTSTIMLQMVDRSTSNAGNGKDAKEQTDVKRDGEVSLCGSMTRQVSLRVVAYGTRRESG